MKNQGITKLVLFIVAFGGLLVPDIACSSDSKAVKINVNPRKIINRGIIGFGWNWDDAEAWETVWPDPGDEESWKEFFEKIELRNQNVIQIYTTTMNLEPVNDNNDPCLADVDSGYPWSKHFDQHPKYKTVKSSLTHIPKHWDNMERTLERCEKYGVQVILGNFIMAHDGTPYDLVWLAESVHKYGKYNPDSDVGDKGKTWCGGPRNDYPYDVDEFGEALASWVYYLKAVKSYECVKYLVVWSEPGTNKQMSASVNYPESQQQLYAAVDKHLRHFRFRKDGKIQTVDLRYDAHNNPKGIKLIGLAGFPYWHENIQHYSTKEDIFRDILKYGGKYFDAIGFNDGFCCFDYEKEYSNWETMSQRNTYILGLTQKLLKEYAPSRDIPVFMTEISARGFCFEEGGTPVIDYYREVLKKHPEVSEYLTYTGRLFLAEYVIRGYNEYNVKAFNPWGGNWQPCTILKKGRRFSDLYEKKLDYTVEKGKKWDINTVWFYPQILLCRYVDSDSDVLATTVSGGQDATKDEYLNKLMPTPGEACSVQRVWPCAIKSPRGEITILIVNDSFQDKPIEVTLPVDKRVVLEKFYVDAKHYNRGVQQGKTDYYLAPACCSIKDVLTARSINVYTNNIPACNSNEQTGKQKRLLTPEMQGSGLY